MKTRLLNFGVAVLLVTGGILAQEIRAADSRDNLAKAKPAQAGEAKAKPQPKAEKPATRTDDFKDRDNNGVDDRHEKRAIRSEPAATPPVKQDPKTETSRQSRPTPPPAAPPPGKPEEPPPKSPPGR